MVKPRALYDHQTNGFKSDVTPFQDTIILKNLIMIWFGEKFRKQRERMFISEYDTKYKDMNKKT